MFLVVAGALGGSVQSRLSSGGLNEASAESSRGEALLEERFGTGSPNVLLFVTAEDGDVDAPEVATAGRRLTAELAASPRGRSGAQTCRGLRVPQDLPLRTSQQLRHRGVPQVLLTCLHLFPERLERFLAEGVRLREHD
ncbi:MAG: hypothetical protein H0U26_08230, partial [Acidimicrobiia bacterium]|nr:hypothetical protein [Acidimicrobiia bacterium]